MTLPEFKTRLEDQLAKHTRLLHKLEDHDIQANDTNSLNELRYEEGFNDALRIIVGELNEN